MFSEYNMVTSYNIVPIHYARVARQLKCVRPIIHFLYHVHWCNFFLINEKEMITYEQVRGNVG